MASEIRVNKINSSSGVGTITLSPTGVDISGITTVSTLKVGTGVTASEDGDIFFTGVCTATTFAGAHSGSGANLTSLPAAQITGTLPAISGANLTNLTATNLTGTIADARFPATLPAASAANLTSIPAANITGTLPAISGANLTNLAAANLTGTIADARFPATLPAASAANLTSIPAANITGTLPAISGANLTGITAPIFGNYAVLMDVKSEGNDGGTFTANQWQVRDLNTEYYDPDSIVTLNNNIFVLNAGYYFIRFSATAHRVGTHKCVLFRESGTQTIFAHGSSERLVTDGGSNRSEGIWRGQISGTVNLQIRHRCSSTRDNDGLGKASSAGEELYTIVEIFKEA